MYYTMDSANILQELGQDAGKTSRLSIPNPSQIHYATMIQEIEYIMDTITAVIYIYIITHLISQWNSSSFSEEPYSEVQAWPNQ